MTDPANGYPNVLPVEFSKQFERDLSTLRKAAEAVMKEFTAHIEAEGVVHWNADCPEDDTCTCENVQRIEKALASLRSELAKTTPTTPETPAPHPG